MPEERDEVQQYNNKYVEVRNIAVDKIKQWLYYIIIGVISFISLVFLPMIGSEVELDWALPTTTVGWIVWVAVKLIVSTINVLIFHSFMQQAKLNIRDNANYKKAYDLLFNQKNKEQQPRSPKKWNSQQYGRKATVIFITTSLTTVALTQAILTFDWMAMLTYLFTIVMGLIFGVMQMKSAEDYWTDEFLRYALLIDQQRKEKENEECSQSETKSTET